MSDRLTENGDANWFSWWEICTGCGENVADEGTRHADDCPLEYPNF